MKLEYEYYGTYDDNAGDKINLEIHIRSWLREVELLFEYVAKTKPDILETFLMKVESKYLGEIEGRSFELADVGFDRLANDQTLLSAHSNFKDFALRVIMRYIPFREGYILSEDEEYIRWLDFLRPKYLLLYHCLTTLVEILGRDVGIDFYKEFILFWGKELAKKPKRTAKIEDVRKERVKTWKEGNAMEFGVFDVTKSAFLAKFDKCISHESMKHVEDQELAFYTVCYPAPVLLEHAHQNISMRRTQTLFTADFCDELRWDRHAHEKLEQPSLEFSRKLVRK
jgi:hypothetical protein